MFFFNKSYWQPWIWRLFTSHRVVYLESSFTNVGIDLRIYLLPTHGDQLQWRTLIF